MRKEPPQNLLGNALRDHREKIGLSQSELAKKAGLLVHSIESLELSLGNLADWNQVLLTLKLRLRGRNLPPAWSIGESLRCLRKRLGINSQALANSLGVAHAALVALETRSEGQVSTLNAALSFLGACPLLVEEGVNIPFYSHAAKSSSHHAWRTPKWLMDTLHEVFGIWDLDPCSPTKDGKTTAVRAKNYFTKEDDGLSLPWFGNVFLNPPYGRAIKDWLRKGNEEVKEKRAEMVCALIPARTDTLYWSKYIAGEATVVFLRGRLSFNDCGQPAPFPSALIFWGGDATQIERITSAIPGAWNPSQRRVPSVRSEQQISQVENSNH